MFRRFHPLTGGATVSDQVRQYAITWAKQEDVTTQAVQHLVQQAKEKLPKRLADYGWSVHLEQDGFVLRHANSTYDTPPCRDLRDAINQAEAMTKTRHFQLENGHRLNGHQQEPLPAEKTAVEHTLKNRNVAAFAEQDSPPKNRNVQNSQRESFQDRVSAPSLENHDGQNCHNVTSFAYHQARHGVNHFVLS